MLALQFVLHKAYMIFRAQQVMVLRLQTAGTVEEHIFNVAMGKKSFADRSITGAIHFNWATLFVDGAV
jgi:hypothetical protein